ncbi:MAG: GxxExxY protein [Candidatus Cloacimonetes bacterium]|jgi:GxxExxY protein|nr:GxxExxY protein [Candidatus Cloacimonadota bacterium]MDD3144342.1 GxxExxY protein [Candidatus Cloacimonadota bacterium]MDY0366029.1 GxxExxY protein [Candidatus Syntrophosphaera sp.]
MMDSPVDSMLLSELTDRIIACFYTVYNSLGFGFLEKVYENAFVHELNKQGLKALAQYPIKVYYGGIPVGEYFADVVVEGLVIVELKAASTLANDHILQLQNYLRATNIEVGLLLNFGIKPEIRRKTYLNTDKKVIVTE